MSIPLTPLFATQGASLLLKLREEGPRRGSIVEAMLDTVGLPADASWEAAFVQFIGYWMHFDHEGRHSSWPIPMAGTFTDIIRFARERGAIHDEPRVGDIAAVRHRVTGEYVQGGFVVGICDTGTLLHSGRRMAYHDCLTIEGDTDLGGTIGGSRVSRVPRRIVPDAGDCFIRWVDLDARGADATPWLQTERVMGRTRFAKAA